MSDDDRARFASALGTGQPADEACRLEVIGGAVVDLSLGTVGVANLEVIYTRRLEHLRHNEIRFVGADVLERLRDAGEESVRLAGVQGQDNYVVFLAPDDDRVLACIGVDGAVANPEFTVG